MGSKIFTKKCTNTEKTSIYSLHSVIYDTVDVLEKQSHPIYAGYIQEVDKKLTKRAKLLSLAPSSGSSKDNTGRNQCMLLLSTYWRIIDKITIL